MIQVLTRLGPAGLVAVLGLAAPGLTSGSAARSQLPGPSVHLIDTALLTAPRLLESSGVVASRIRPGVLWTHNDSGDGPILYATDSTGRDLGFVTVAGARAVDWEDIATGPCVRSEEACLYVADIGDNAARRRSVVVYRLREPEPPASAADTLRRVPLMDSIVLRYPDRARDAEGIAVTPDGTLLLVTKGRGESALLFRARLPAHSADLVLELVGPLEIRIDLLRGRLVTGADLSPDGSVLVVRTYVSLHFFKMRGTGRPTPLTSEQGIPIPVVEGVGEGVAFHGPAMLVLTSERGPSGHALLSRLSLNIPES